MNEPTPIRKDDDPRNGIPLEEPPTLFKVIVGAIIGGLILSLVVPVLILLGRLWFTGVYNLWEWSLS